MIQSYLLELKEKGNYSWADIAKKSSISVSHVRRIFDGEIRDPGYGTISAIVEAMNGDLSELQRKLDGSAKEDPAIGVCERRIRELERQCRILGFALGVLILFFLVLFAIDFFNRNVGWLR